MNDDEILSLLADGIAEVQSGNVRYQKMEWATVRLNSVWNPQPRPAGQISISKAPQHSSPKLPTTKRPPPWHIGMTSSFTKAITKIDRKLQGHILEALTKITENPTVIHGDTVKPLTGKFKGYWRYRIDAYRLIYAPDHSSGDITLLAFAPRGGIYDD